VKLEGARPGRGPSICDRAALFPVVLASCSGSVGFEAPIRGGDQGGARLTPAPPNSIFCAAIQPGPGRIFHEPTLNDGSSFEMSRYQERGDEPLILAAAPVFPSPLA
jgi:hypothetical protein